LVSKKVTKFLFYNKLLFKSPIIIQMIDFVTW